MVEAADTDVGGGARAARLLLQPAGSPGPTAVVAQSDLLAAGVLQAAGELGLRVPEDLSVTGFDGIDLPWLAAPLTTVDQHGERKGRALGRMVAALLQGAGEDQAADVTLDTELRIGGTTGPPPAR
jgi:DNA-binding LacI/PurR family transcriptional regulator